MESIKTLFNTFLEYYKKCKEVQYHFILSEFQEADLSRIKTISLKDYYISCASDMLRLYKKNECKEINKFFLFKKRKIY